MNKAKRFLKEALQGALLPPIWFTTLIHILLFSTILWVSIISTK